MQHAGELLDSIENKMFNHYKAALLHERRGDMDSHEASIKEVMRLFWEAREQVGEPWHKLVGEARGRARIKAQEAI